jgi:hypothetical protein
MVNDYGPDLRRRLRDAGCYFKRTAKGDHEMWYSSPISRRSFPVDHKIKSRHTANEVLKQAGLRKAF